MRRDTVAARTMNSQIRRHGGSGEVEIVDNSPKTEGVLPGAPNVNQLTDSPSIDSNPVSGCNEKLCSLKDEYIPTDRRVVSSEETGIPPLAGRMIHLTGRRQRQQTRRVLVNPHAAQSGTPPIPRHRSPVGQEQAAVARGGAYRRVCRPGRDGRWKLVATGLRRQPVNQSLL